MGLFSKKPEQPIIIDADETYEESLQREASQLRGKIDRQVAQSNLQDQIRRDRNEEKMQVIRNRWKERG
jgi:hypothetical protein